MLGAQQVEQLFARLGLGDDPILDVRSVEARHEMSGFGELEPLGDLGVRRCGRGRGQRDAGHIRPYLVQHRQLQIVGTEVVAPLRDAVRLVDREQRDAATLQQPPGARDGQTLRPPYVEQVEFLLQEGGFDPAALLGVLR